MSGFGRGGRGAALLKLLEESEARAPGYEEQTPTPVPTPSEPHPLYQQPPSHLAAPIGRASAFGANGGNTNTNNSAPIGRGQLMARILRECGGDTEPKFSQPAAPVLGAAAAAAAAAPAQAAVSGSGYSTSSAVSHAMDRGTPSPSSVSHAMGDLSIKENQPPFNRRGTSGQPMQMACNYIRLKKTFRGVYQYSVAFNPIIDSKRMANGLLYEHSHLLGEANSFDGTILYLAKMLPDKVTHLTSTRKTDGRAINVRLTFTKEVEPTDCIHLFNVVLKRVMRRLELRQVQRRYYNPKAAIHVPQHRLEIWPGYVTSIRQDEGGLLLLIDDHHKVLRNQNALDLMAVINQGNRAGGRHNFQDQCLKQLVGQVVMTRYNNNTYRVDDIAWDMNPTCTFERHGEVISFCDYYRVAHSKEVTDLKQPLLVSRLKKEQRQEKGASSKEVELVHLVPEFCYLTGITDEMRNDFRVMKDINAHTRVTPMQRARSIRKFIQNVNENPDALGELRRWGLELDTDILQTEGRHLPVETVIFRSKQVGNLQIPDWGSHAGREKVISAVGLHHWALVHTRRDSQRAQDFISVLKQVTPAMGIQVNQPLLVGLDDDRTETYLQGIKSVMGPQLQLVVAIFPSIRSDRYNAVKKLCCVDSPVPSQVIVAKTISDQRKVRSVCTKIALQINCKLGGELWALKIPLDQLMVVGVDVYHDPVQRNRSIAGFVASTNRELTRWYSRVVYQMPGEELVNGLKLCLTASLKKFHELNHALPDRIIVYRDGVGDGQLPVVKGHEVEQLTHSFAHFGPDYKPKLAVVIVQKRINQRIFSVTNRGQQVDNAPSGSIMDHTITRPWPDMYDFFLVSQHVRQGTVAPTHYVVAHDTSQLKAEHMQRLTYKLTHLYYNWPGTIRVPAPCQYAHKLAYLVGQNLQKEPSLLLSDRLFFL